MPVPPSHSGCQRQTFTLIKVYQAPAVGMGPATSRASFVVIFGLTGTPSLIGMDLMMPLCMQIDAARCPAISRSIHTLQAKEEPFYTAKSAHVSVELAMQTTTTSSTSGGSDAVQAVLLQEAQVPTELNLFLLFR